MKLWNGRWIATVLAAVFVSTATSAQAEDSTYTLALSWQPAFCESDAGGAKPECRGQNATSWDALHFTLHGLWPNSDGGQDTYCLAGPARSQAIRRDETAHGNWRDLDPVDLPRATRQALDRVMPGTASGLERHEWVKHGTCSDFTPARYFAAAIGRAEDVAGTAFNAYVADHAGDIVDRRDLLTAFERDFGKGAQRALQLICARREGDAYLAEIRLALFAARIEQELAPATLSVPRKAMTGNCPTRIIIDAAG